MPDGRTSSREQAKARLKDRNVDPGLIRALKEVAKTTTFQMRKLAFWIVFFVLVAGLVYVVRNAGDLFASTEDLIESPTFTNSAYTVNIAIDSQGKVFIDERPNYRAFRPLKNIDEFKYKVLDKPGTVIDQLIVRTSFEAGIPEGTKFETFAVHGIESADYKQLDDNTVEYYAYGVSPDSTFTIAAQMPPGTIDWPAWKQAAAFVYTLPIQVWLGLAIALPFFTTVLLILMFYSRIRNFFKGEPTTVIDQPPVPISPAVAGILVNGTVSSREIAATLLDLANRGYITIFNKGDGVFSFAKRRPWQDLQSFELTLLGQMFENPGYKTSNSDLEVAVGMHLFSPQITRVYLAMYDAATASGYFEKNPAVVHSRYRFTGLALFFVALAVFVASLLIDLQPAYITFFFAGVMAMALVIMFAADSVPLRTKAGEEARLQWLSFRNYLAVSQPLGYIEGAQQFYQRYLPYAVVLKAEVPWVHRFQNFPFRIPDWYGSVEESPTIEAFANGLYRIVGSVAQLFAQSKEPTVH